MQFLLFESANEDTEETKRKKNVRELLLAQLSSRVPSKAKAWFMRHQ